MTRPILYYSGFYFGIGITCRKNDIKYKYVLADNWFSSKENIEFIDKTLHKYFILGLKSNRTVALSISDKKNNGIDIIFRLVKKHLYTEETSLRLY